MSLLKTPITFTGNVAHAIYETPGLGSHASYGPKMHGAGLMIGLREGPYPLEFGPDFLAYKVSHSGVWIEEENETIGGAVVTVLAINALGTPDVEKGMNDAASVAASLGVDPSAGVGERLASLKEDKMHMFLPKTHDAIPWTALLIGLWIPNFYYWGLNQYIVQRTLGSKTLAEGQKGIVFAAGMKLIIPFVVCVPGIIAFTLYSGEMAAEIDGDAKTNRPVLLEFAKTSGTPLPEDIRLAIANGSGRTTAEMGEAERLAITDDLLEQTEAGPDGRVYLFNGDFAEREPSLATVIFGYNASQTGGDEAAAIEAGDALYASSKRSACPSPSSVPNASASANAGVRCPG